MKGARYLLLILTIILVMSSVMSCISAQSVIPGRESAQQISGYDVTATYGAQEFHAQLTAIAREDMATPSAFFP